MRRAESHCIMADLLGGQCSLPVTGAGMGVCTHCKDIVGSLHSFAIQALLRVVVER